MFSGIPFPGDYVLVPDGTVIDKHFLPNYETRPTASGILLTDFDTVGDEGSVSIGAEDVRAKVTLSSDKAVSGQELGVAVDVTIAAGWHIYGEPLPENYVATRVTFSGDLVATQSLKFPAATPREFTALGETLPVYEGTIRGKGTLLVASRIKPGQYKISGTLKFQECNDAICKLPQNVAFELPLTIDGMTPGAKK
jgi:DsbC/DsbD-like thiol-disulfide interchange protein